MNISTPIITTRRFYLFKIILLIACGLVGFNSLGQTIDIQLAAEYWNKGEKEKAYQTYKELAKSPENLALIYSGYFNVLLETARYKEAGELSEKMSRREPEQHTYRLDCGLAHLKAGDLPKSDKIFRENIQQWSQDPYRIKSVADYFIIRGIPEYAEAAFRMTREKFRDPNLYALELANALRIQGKKKEMVEEYLNYVTQTPGNIAYVKNLLQYFLTRPEEQEDLQKVLTTRVQRYPDSEVFADLLTWTFFQQKNFYGAFIQSRAFDRRFSQGNPIKTTELAAIAYNNNELDVAIRCYDFIIREFPRSDSYLNARLGILRAMEARTTRAYPVNKDSVSMVVRDYKILSEQYPDHPNAFEAQISQARLFAFYLNHLDSSTIALNELVNNPRASLPTRARAKLELGDIYLIRNEPWEATLLFSQVEKMQKDAPLGYEAKLKNAKLSYFKGDFQLAAEHLDILEQATSRDIANDALDLSLKISENIMADSAGLALRVYAAAELLLYQNKQKEALQLLNLIKKEPRPASVHRATMLPALLGTGLFRTEQQGDSLIINFNKEIITQPILDDVYWLEAGIFRKEGKFLKATELLKKISEEYPLDILADDAFFTRAEITEQNIGDKEAAKEMYQQFLIQFPGSVYAAEARKRFRQLRGDFLQQPVN